MNKKEEIRKELNEYLDTKIPRTEIDIYKHVVDFIKRDRKKQLILNGVINWVAVNKKLPKQTGDILIYVDGLGVRNAIFNITDNSFSFNSIYKPTHWAELPKPPCL